MIRSVFLLALLAPVASACDTPGSRAASQRDDAAATIASDATTTTTSTSAGDTSVGLPDTSGQTAVCALWNAGRADLSEGAWNGSTQGCHAGDVLAPGRDNALRQVNLYRALAGLPTVDHDPAKDADAQACALMMHANNDIVHAPPASWSCYDATGAATAGLSNLATAPAVFSIDMYMTDGGVANLGHRRWVLSRTLGPIGIGSTSRFSCLRVIDGQGHAGQRWTAWPPPGDVPYEALEHGRGLSTDESGWSLQSDAIDLRAATVTITRDGSPLAIDLRQLASGYGSTFGLGMTPIGWRTEAGATYHVAVRGLSEDIDYDVHVVACE